MASTHSNLPELYQLAMDHNNPSGTGITVTEDVFGHVNGQPVPRFTLSNSKVTVDIVSLGATITSIRMPDKHGVEADIILGFDTPQDYLRPEPDPKHMGAICGRVASRISNASFTLDGKEYKLNPTFGNTFMHGGLIGWDLHLWTASKHVDGVSFTLISPDGDEGFPGTVMAQATYRLTADSRLILQMQAITSKPTPINMINHAYFNLAGHNAGQEGLFNTRMTVNADRYTPLNDVECPTGAIESVRGTVYDLRTPRLLGDILPKSGLDDNLIITRGKERPSGMVFVARATHEPSGRSMEVYSDQPGVWIYSCHKFPSPNSDAPILGKNGAKYTKHAGFCIESGNYPDAVHFVGRFPDSILRPGSSYKHDMIFKFDVDEK